jgi:hypothetical protein
MFAELENDMARINQVMLAHNIVREDSSELKPKPSLPNISHLVLQNRRSTIGKKDSSSFSIKGETQLKEHIKDDYLVSNPGS